MTLWKATNPEERQSAIPFKFSEETLRKISERDYMNHAEAKLKLMGQSKQTIIDKTLALEAKLKVAVEALEWISEMPEVGEASKHANEILEKIKAE